MFNPSIIIYIVSYFTASLIAVLGVAALFGWFFPTYIPENIRLLLGVMMILWGIYRVVSTRMKQQQEVRERDEE
ncbi:MAG: hypothetical protein HY960_04415 [Ignavibacteriae bacterium]|nr:hypothetical protein [Ignavibacteriota bacterium]